MERKRVGRLDASDEDIRRAIIFRGEDMTLARTKAALYFVRCKNYVKVGHTTNFRARFGAFVTGCPFPIQAELVVDTDLPTARAAERVLHAHLAYRKQTGEWFRIRPIEMMELTPVVTDLVGFIEERVQLHVNRRYHESREVSEGSSEDPDPTPQTQLSL